MASSDLSSSTVRDRIAALKKELAELTIAQRKVEAERQGLDAQRDSLINQLTDYSARITSLEEAVNSYAAELKSLERDKKIEDSAIEGYQKQKAVLDDEVDRLKKLVSGAQHRRKTLAQELAGNTEKANLAREEMAKTQEEVAGIINILQVLTENISFTIEQIKGDIQHGNQEALEEASTEFHGYVNDVSQIISTIEQIGLGDLAAFIQNIKMFIENADESVNHIMTRIQENADNAVHSSSEEFDGFMRDLIEIVTNTRLTLKKLQVADLGNIYDAVNSIRANLDSQLDSLLENQSVLAAKETQLDLISKEILRRKKVLEDIATKTKNLLQKNKLKTDLSETTKKNLENVTKQKSKIEEGLTKLKADVSARWDRIRYIVDNVGQAQDSLFDIKVAKITPKMVPLGDDGFPMKSASTPISDATDNALEPEILVATKSSEPQLKAGTTLLKLGKKAHAQDTSIETPVPAASPPVSKKATPSGKAASTKFVASEVTPAVKPVMKKPAVKPSPAKNEAGPLAGITATKPGVIPVTKSVARSATAKVPPPKKERAGTEVPAVKPAPKTTAKSPGAKSIPKKVEVASVKPAAKKAAAKLAPGKKETGVEQAPVAIKNPAKKAAKKAAKKG